MDVENGATMWPSMVGRLRLRPGDGHDVGGTGSGTGPHIGYVYPAGGRQGTTFQVTVGGQHLAGVSRALVSGVGVEASVVEYVKPTSRREAAELRLQLLRELQKNATDGENPQDHRRDSQKAGRGGQAGQSGHCRNGDLA